MERTNSASSIPLLKKSGPAKTDQHDAVTARRSSIEAKTAPLSSTPAPANNVVPLNAAWRAESEPVPLSKQSSGGDTLAHGFPIQEPPSTTASDALVGLLRDVQNERDTLHASLAKRTTQRDRVIGLARRYRAHTERMSVWADSELRRLGRKIQRAEDDARDASVRAAVAEAEKGQSDLMLQSTQASLQSLELQNQSLQRRLELAEIALASLEKLVAEKDAEAEGVQELLKTVTYQRDAALELGSELLRGRWMRRKRKELFADRIDSLGMTPLSE